MPKQTLRLLIARTLARLSYAQLLACLQDALAMSATPGNGVATYRIAIIAELHKRHSEE